MSALEELFPKYALAYPAAVDQADSNGAHLNLFSYRQLEFLSQTALRNRAMEIEAAYRKSNKKLPYPLPSRSNDETIHWILVMQAFFMDGEVHEDTLRRFGASNAMIQKEKERMEWAVERTSTPVFDTRRQDSVLIDPTSRGIGHGKKHIDAPPHYHIGRDDFEEGNRNRRPERIHFPQEDHFGDTMTPETGEHEYSRHGTKELPEAEMGIGHRCLRDANSNNEQDLGGKRRHIPVLSSMVNVGTSDDTSGRRNETVPGQGHGPKHVDHFFTSSAAQSGRQENYAPKWRRDPQGLIGHMGV